MKHKRRARHAEHERHPTSTILVASPSPATAGATVRLTATETASGGTHVAGHVQFEVGEVDIGTPIAVDGTGVATTSTTFAAAGRESLSADFTPAGASFGHSEGTFSLVVNPVSRPSAGSEPISVMVPRSGGFTVTIDPGPVQLTPSGSIATGKLPDVTVTDTRNYYPGWSLSGQASRFTYSRNHTGKSVPGNQLGWVPTVVGSQHGGAQLGRAVAPGRPGLGSAPATLAFAPAGCGFGTNILSAKLTLDIPPAVVGRYSGTVTITYVESQPASTTGCGRTTCDGPSDARHNLDDRCPAGGDR
ncbi:MAG TPA: Ig-like domain-containing protein [Streptosporangiaceae bacterium]|nr:Ig-like domain-containing protein [Streptosporangiaceae bacterium]